MMAREKKQKGKKQRAGCYLDSKVTLLKTPCRPQERAIPLGDGWFGELKERWVTFLHPDGKRQVSLLIPERGSPSAAMLEWFIQDAISSGTMDFDVRSLPPLWEHGPGPSMKLEACGYVHVGGTRHAGWGPEVLMAHQVYAATNYQGLNPYEVAAAIEPDRRLPFFGSLGRDPIPPEARWVYPAIDLGQSVEPQLEGLRETLTRMRDYVHRLAGKPIPRPSRHETSRDVLIFTLKYSAGLTDQAIVKIVFPEENQVAAEAKVRTILKRIRRILRQGGS